MIVVEKSAFEKKLRESGRVKCEVRERECEEFVTIAWNEICDFEKKEKLK